MSKKKGVFPDYDEDIFISYAHLDNHPLKEGHGGWVDFMHERLTSRLAQLLGEEPKIWRDLKLHGNDYFNDALVLKLSKIAILVAVLSPRYIKSESCLEELREFYHRAGQIGDIGVNTKARIFKVVKTPIDADKQPAELKDLLGYKFYEIDQSSGKPREFSHEIGFGTFNKFMEKLEDLAWDIKALIEQMRKDSANSLEQNTTPNKFIMTETIKKSEALHPLRVFLCHSSGDKPAVRSLYHRLRVDSFDPWLDEENLLPGEEWEKEIPKAVRESDIVVVCISHNSITKSGYLQKEIKFALDVADEQPEGTIFLIPIKLEECDVPERLRRWQWVNLFEDEEKGYERLVRALKVRASKLRAATGKDI